MGRNVMMTNRVGQIVGDEMSCTEMSSHRYSRIYLQELIDNFSLVKSTKLNVFLLVAAFIK